VRVACAPHRYDRIGEEAWGAWARSKRSSRKRPRSGRPRAPWTARRASRARAG
jgi:hypothetical protein